MIDTTSLQAVKEEVQKEGYIYQHLVNVMANRHSPVIGLKEEVKEASNSPHKVTINPPDGMVFACITICIYTSWIICTSSSPQIAMDAVLNYRPGRTTPLVRLKIRWEEDAIIPMKLTGVASPQSFMLEHPQNTPTRGKSSKYIIM